MAEKTPLQLKYDAESKQLGEDIAFLQEKILEYNDQIQEIVSLALPSDELYAQTVMDANRFLGQAVNFATVASGCGCSVAIANTATFLAGTATTVFYEIAQAVMENASSDSYTGDDPQGDGGTVNLTSGIGGDTVLEKSNFGKGVSNQVGTGSSVILLSVNAVQPVSGGCTQSCSALYTAQQAAITAYNNARASGPRTQYDNTSTTIKEEAKEYRLQRWSFGKAEKYTQDRKTRIKNFYPNASASGIGT